MPQESVLYPAKELTDQQRANATWRYESLNIMLWTLGKIEQLSSPGEICDVETIVGLLLKAEDWNLKNRQALKTKLKFQMSLT